MASLPNSMTRPPETTRAPIPEDSPARLLADVAASLTLDSWTVPEAGDVSSVDQGVVLNILPLDLPDQNRAQTQVGIYWEGDHEGRVVISQPAFAARALHRAGVRRTALSGPTRIDRAFARAGSKASIAVAPLLFSALTRDPSLPHGADLIHRA